jgi:hypothetical protein
MFYRGKLWKSTAMMSLVLALIMGFTPRVSAAEAALKQRTILVQAKLLQSGISASQVDEMIRYLSISEVEYIASNPKLLKELGAPEEENQGASGEAALAGLILLLITLTWAYEVHENSQAAANARR